MDPKPAYLTDGNVEDLGRMLMGLLSEFWVLRDRVAVLEKVLEERGGLSGGELDAYVPSLEFEQQLQALRDQVVTNVVAAPLLAEDRSIETILTLGGHRRD